MRITFFCAFLLLCCDVVCGGAVDARRLGADAADADGATPSTPSTPSGPPVDLDGDGVDDATDNCLGLFNPVQTDSEIADDALAPGGDGLGDPCDCAPFHPGEPLPGDVGASLRLARETVGAATLTWSAIPVATRYDVYRGTIPAGGMASLGPAAYDHVCFEDDDANDDGLLAAVDSEPPLAGAGFYYLVAGDGGCGSGGLGPGADAAPRPNPGACPPAHPPLGSIAGSVVSDVTDPFGASMALEPAVSANVELLEGGIVVASTLTDPAGQYFFAGLHQESYEVRASAPDARTATLAAPVLAGSTTLAHFAVVPRKVEGIFGGYAGFAVEPGMPTPDMDFNGIVDLVDVGIATLQVTFDPDDADADLNQDGSIDPTDVQIVGGLFGRTEVALDTPYQIAVTGGGSTVNIDNGGTVVRSQSGSTTAVMSWTGEPTTVGFEVTDSIGELFSAELGPFGFGHDVVDPSSMTLDLDSGRILGGTFTVVLDGDFFPEPLPVAGDIADGFVALAPSGFSLHHLVGIDGILPASFPLFGGSFFLMGKCDPPKDDVACARRSSTSADGCNDRFGRAHSCVDDPSGLVSFACNPEGAACARKGKCGTCQTICARVGGGWYCDCECH